MRTDGAMRVLGQSVRLFFQRIRFEFKEQCFLDIGLVGRSSLLLFYDSRVC